MISLGETVGDALYDGKFYATTNYGWDSIYEYMDLYNYNLYGDPALEVAGATAGVAWDVSGRETAALHLKSGEPNPFTSATSLRFTLSAAQRVSIAVHDVMGRRVAGLADREYAAGEHSVTWNGADNRGERIASGLYFITAETGSQTAVRKVVLLK
jgi:hypothetical protein